MLSAAKTWGPSASPVVPLSSWSGFVPEILGVGNLSSFAVTEHAGVHVSAESNTGSTGKAGRPLLSRHTGSYLRWAGRGVKQTSGYLQWGEGEAPLNRRSIRVSTATQQPLNQTNIPRPLCKNGQTAARLPSGGVRTHFCCPSVIARQNSVFIIIQCRPAGRLVGSLRQWFYCLLLNSSIGVSTLIG